MMTSQSSFTIALWSRKGHYLLNLISKLFSCYQKTCFCLFNMIMSTFYDLMNPGCCWRSWSTWTTSWKSRASPWSSWTTPSPPWRCSTWTSSLPSSTTSSSSPTSTMATSPMRRKLLSGFLTFGKMLDLWHKILLCDQSKVDTKFISTLYTLSAWCFWKNTRIWWGWKKIFAFLFFAIYLNISKVFGAPCESRDVFGAKEVS